MPKNIGKKILSLLNKTLVNTASAIEQAFDTIIDMGSACIRAFVIKTVDDDHIEDIFLKALDGAVHAAKELDITAMIKSIAGGAEFSTPVLLGEDVVEMDAE
jgi:hypothetical protein